MVNYGNGKIYKIQRIGGNSKIYVGSTTKQYLSQRMDTHRHHYKEYQAGKRHLTTSFLLFDEYGIENCEIVLLETVNCNSKDELLMREKHFYQTIDCVNKNSPFRSNDEIKQYQDEYNKDYYISNKEKIKQNVKNYADNNKDKIKEKTRKYRETNKDKIKMHKGKIVECECGASFTHNHKSRHIRTKFHLEFINSKV